MRVSEDYVFGDRRHLGSFIDKNLTGEPFLLIDALDAPGHPFDIRFMTVQDDAKPLIHCNSGFP